MVLSNFKSDESFLAKLTVGAAGTNATISRLKELGFNPIELERGSTDFKIWKRIKIKRVRVPDVLCLDTGLRFESRGKKKPEISMSHSLSDPKRAWDAGMRDNDFVAIVILEQREEAPLDVKRISPVHFIAVKDMRNAFANQQTSITVPKGVEEGSEIRVMWKCAVSKETATVSSVQPERIVLNAVCGGQQQAVLLKRGNIRLLPQVKPGDTVVRNQIVAAVVPVEIAILPPQKVEEDYFVARLTSVSLSERYAAAKALRYRGYADAKAALQARLADGDEDIYVQLEAAAALAAYDDELGWRFIERKLRGPAMSVPLETQLETVIVASEIPKEPSERLLIEVLRDPDRDCELRAGAAWALGQFASAASASALVDTFNSTSLEVKTEAARALLRISDSQVANLVDLLRSGDHSKRDGIAWVLARTGGFEPADVLTEADDNLRRWASYILGYGRDRLTEAHVDAVLGVDPEVYFASSVLWQILSSWVSELKEY